MEEIVGPEELSQLLGIDSSRIRQLVSTGVIKRIEEGKYPLRENIHAYIKYLKGLSNRSSPGGSSYEKERTRLYKARADKAEMEAGLLSGELYHGDAILAVVGEMLVNFRSRLLAIPSSCAGIIADQTDPKQCQQILESNIMLALNEISKIDSSKIVNWFVKQAGKDSEASDEADTQSVGRRK